MVSNALNNYYSLTAIVEGLLCGVLFIVYALTAKIVIYQINQQLYYTLLTKSIKYLYEYF